MINDTSQARYTSSEPLVVAQKCPVCNGYGTLKYGSLVCHGCSGKGYILIPNNISSKKSEK